MESVTGLSPAIAIEQRTTVSHPALHGGHGHRDLRPPAGAVRRAGPAALPALRASRSRAQTRGRRSRSSLLATAAGRRRSRCWPRSSRGRKGAFRKELARAARRGLLQRARIDGRASTSSEPLAARPAPQPPHRGAGGPAGPAARGARSGCWPAWSRPSTSRGDVVLVVHRGRRGAALQPAPGLRRVRRLGARAVARAPSPSTAPTAPARPATAWASRWDVDAAQGHARRAAARCSTAPSIPGSATARAWCARRSRTWPRATASRWRRRCATLPRKARAGAAARRRQRLPGRPALPAAPRWRSRAAARPATTARPSRDGGEAFEDLRPYLSGRGLPGLPRARACGRRAWPCASAGARMADYVRLPVDARRGAAFAALAFPERERPVADRLLPEILDAPALPGARSASAT